MHSPETVPRKMRLQLFTRYIDAKNDVGNGRTTTLPNLGLFYHPTFHTTSRILESLVDPR